ncbi:MAG: single-stranded-DNA-specific exonuclease RecJ [Clostridia bacterium]|nr:single-stranded-DNA-specific exonuclease RecJ [Clostridia bacterium]
MKRQWILRKHNNALVSQIMEKYNISQLTARVLQNRIETLGDSVLVDKNDISAMHSPFLLNDMQKAVDIINNAVDFGKHITIYGDYDADGVTATSLLYSYLSSIGAYVDYYVPDRMEEGYGINKDAVDYLKTKGTQLLITVDTGATAFEQIQYAVDSGMEVIVTDHHECQDELPNCSAVINPKRHDSTYPFKDIAGVAVAFKLVCALNESVEDIIENYIELVCIGTVSDVMPLIDENRIFVTIGLEHLNRSNFVGINSLIEAVGLKGKNITAGSIGFTLGPRINACGRLGNASQCVTLFTTDDQDEADMISQNLNSINTQRQEIEQSILTEAISIIEKNNLYNNSVIVVGKEGWHHGVIGIVASKIAEKYYKPTILLCIDGEYAKGSGRSIENFDLFSALNSVSDDLEKFGGHCLAAGVTVKTSNIDKFSQDINMYALSVMEQIDFVPKLYVDCNICSRDLTEENINNLAVLEPYGSGNTQPVFSLMKCQIYKIATLGENKHIRMLLILDNMIFSAVGFGMGRLINNYKQGDIVDVAGHLEINVYNNKNNIQIRLKDIRLSTK